MKHLIKLPSLERIGIVYYLLASLRFILTLIPQRGYIHPDEFFQSVEIMAGDVFDVESNRPWEFNSTFPIRSVFTPYVMTGIPYKILQIFDSNIQLYFNLSLRSPYWLLVFPRIYHCLLSFIIDYCLYKICAINYEKYRKKLLLLASSYVVQVYGTHTFSNTVEMILMSVLLYLVVDSQSYSHTIIRQDQYLKKKYKKADGPADRARFYKMRASLPSHTVRNCILISFIVVTGIFNRPTFIAFAFPCVFFWIHRGIGFKMVRYSDVHYRMVLFLLNSLLFTCLFIIIDSFYFGYISSAEIMQFDISISNFVVTPLNFIKYNMDVNMLSGHGLHPRFTHLLVNIPLLYNILGVIAIGGLFILCYRFVSGQFVGMPRIHSIRCLMSVSAIIPVAALSYFPHQEPRFLIPITLPLIYLYGDILTSKTFLLRLWWTLNAACVLFFGFIHQAGLIPLATHITTELQSSSNQPIHLVTSHVYNLPISLLMQRNSRRLYGEGSSKYLLPKMFVLYEMGSSESASAVLQRLDVIRNVQEQKQLQHSGRKLPELYLAQPISKEFELTEFILESKLNFSVERVKTFYPHVSTEALPDFLFDPCSERETEDCSKLSVSYLGGFLFNVLRSCGLGLYKVYRNNQTIVTINDKAFV